MLNEFMKSRPFAKLLASNGLLYRENLKPRKKVSGHHEHMCRMRRWPTDRENHSGVNIASYVATVTDSQVRQKQKLSIFLGAISEEGILFRFRECIHGRDHCHAFPRFLPKITQLLLLSVICCSNVLG